MHAASHKNQFTPIYINDILYKNFSEIGVSDLAPPPRPRARLFLFDEGDNHFQRLQLMANNGATRMPSRRVIRAVRVPAAQGERQRLGLGDGAYVFRFRRLLLLDDTPTIMEDIIVSDAMFPDLLGREMPMDLYEFYRDQFNVTIGKISDRLQAVVLEPDIATLLEVRPGTPALQIRRIAYDVDERAVELRHSLCLTEDFHYHCDLV